MSADPMPTEFSMSFSRWMRILTALMLLGPQHCTATVSADRLDVKMGMGSWTFAASLHRSSIVRVTRVNRPVWGWGAHGWRGRWLVNGSSHGLVQLDIDPPEHGRCLVFAIKLVQLTLSLEDPDGFVAALSDTSSPAT